MQIKKETLANIAEMACGGRRGIIFGVDAFSADVYVSDGSNTIHFTHPFTKVVFSKGAIIDPGLLKAEEYLKGVLS